MITIPAKTGWEVKLAPPTALAKEINSTTSYPRDLPTPDNDGSFIRLPANNIGVLERYNAAGTQVWSVAHTGIHANCDYWTGVFWLDTTDSAIWVWAYDTGTAPDTYYLARVALSDGAVTNIGTCQPGDGKFANLFAYYYFERAAMGSGNLTIRDGNYKIILSTSDGSIVSAATEISQNGIAIPATSSYQAADESIYLTKFPYGTTSTASTYGYMLRGGRYGAVLLPKDSPGVSALSYAWPMLWGDCVAIAAYGAYVFINARFFERTAFDDWLVRIADYYGFPT